MSDRTRATWSALIVLGTLCLITFTHGCSKTAGAREPGRYYSKNNRFSIRFPETWEQKLDFLNTEVSAESPLEGAGDFTENIGVYVKPVPQGMDADEYIQANLANTDGKLPDYSKESEGMAVLEGGADARWIVFIHSVGDSWIKSLAYVVIEGRKAYVIICMSTGADFSSHRDEFEMIAESFRIE